MWPNWTFRMLLRSGEANNPCYYNRASYKKVGWRPYATPASIEYVHNLFFMHMLNVLLLLLSLYLFRCRTIVPFLLPTFFTLFCLLLLHSFLSNSLSFDHFSHLTNSSSRWSSSSSVFWLYGLHYFSRNSIKNKYTNSQKKSNLS